jgi:hypothetical protein
MTEKEMGKTPVVEDNIVNKDAITTSDKDSIQARLLKFSKLTKIKTQDKVVYLPTNLAKNLATEDQNLYNWYLTEILESKSSERMDRYKEYLFMDSNATEISMALDTYANEAVQLGKVSTGIIADSSSPELKVIINKLLSKLRLNNINFLSDMARGLCKYGDKPFAVEINDQGVEAIEAIDPMNFYRLEKFIKVSDKGDLAFFDGAEKGKFQTTLNQTFDQSFYDQDNKEESFKVSDYRPYLLGFKINDKVVPPWNCVHFRMFCSEPAYYPYGRAVIESVRPTYRHLLSLEILMSLIKSTKFKKTNYHLKTTATYDNPYDLFTKLNDLRQSYNDHIVGESTRARNPSQTAEVWTAESADSSLTVKQLDSAVDTAEGVKDVEYVQNKLWMGLRLPKSYLLSDKSDNNTGDALIQQDLKLARLIYTIQSSILSGVVRIIQIHLVTIGKESEINNFSLSLPYPVPAYNLIELKAQSDRIDHVKKFGELLSDTLGVKELPLKSVRRLLVDMAHMNETLIDNIIKDIETEKVLKGGGSVDSAVDSSVDTTDKGTTISDNNPVPSTDEPKKESIDDKFKKIKDKLEEKLTKDLEKDILNEWEVDSRHHFHSRSISMTDDIILSDKVQGSFYKQLVTESLDAEIKSNQEITEEMN